MRQTLKILRALSDETRLRIVNLLYENELCVCHIEKVLNITQTKASRHLTYLKNAQLASDRKDAQWVFYSFVKNEDMNFIDSLIYENLRKKKIFQDDLSRLKLSLENQECCK